MSTTHEGELDEGDQLLGHLDHLTLPPLEDWKKKFMQLK